MNNVEIYGTPSCTYCTAAKNLCESRDIPFVYKDISEDSDALFHVMDMIGSFTTVPQVFVNGEHVGGFDDLRELVNEDKG